MAKIRFARRRLAAVTRADTHRTSVLHYLSLCYLSMRQFYLQITGCLAPGNFEVLER